MNSFFINGQQIYFIIANNAQKNSVRIYYRVFYELSI